MRLHPYIYVLFILMACTAMACKSDIQTQPNTTTQDAEAPAPAIETFKKVKDITLEELENNVAQELSEIETEKTEEAESADINSMQELQSVVTKEKTVAKKKRKKKIAKTKISTKPKKNRYL